VSRLWPLARRYGFDAMIVVVALENAVAAAVAGSSGDAPRTTRWFTVPASAAIVLVLLARRRFPFAAPASVWLMGAALSFIDGRLATFNGATLAAGLAAALLLGNLPDSVEARLGLIIGLAGAAVVVENKPGHQAEEFIFIPVLVAIAWLAGFALHERSEQTEAAEGRARIARELHDIVAHSLSVMVLQAGAVRHRLAGDLAEDKSALEEVEEAGRQALAEMRRLLGVMRRDDDERDLTPQPSLASVDALVDQISGAGLPVHLHVEGEPIALPTGIELSAYRIIQEGLTNALKHGRASRADVTLRYIRDALEVEVCDDGQGRATTDGAGYGLLGIQERVKIYGGTMTAETAPGRGFALKTRLPLESHV